MLAHNSIKMLYRLLDSSAYVIITAWYILSTFIPVLPWRRLLGTIVGVVLIVLGGAACSLMSREIGRGFQSRYWPQVAGLIIESRIDVREKNFWPRVRYQYQIGETIYQGETILFGGEGSTDRVEAEAMMGRYPSGVTVPISYDPNDPATACLEPGAVAWTLFFGLLLFGGMVWLGIAVIRKESRHTQLSSFQLAPYDVLLG
jgi:hypothetical protein